MLWNSGTWAHFSAQKRAVTKLAGWNSPVFRAERGILTILARLLALVRPGNDLVLRRIRSLKRCVQACGCKIMTPRYAPQFGSRLHFKRCQALPKETPFPFFTGWGTTSTRAKVALGWRGKLSLLTSATTSERGANLWVFFHKPTMKLLPHPPASTHLYKLGKGKREADGQLLGAERDHAGHELGRLRPCCSKRAGLSNPVVRAGLSGAILCWRQDWHAPGPHQARTWVFWAKSTESRHSCCSAWLQ